MNKQHSDNLSIAFSEEQAMLADSAAAFCREKSPIEAVRAQLKIETGFDADVWTALVALGWMGIAIPEQYGGSGLGVGCVIPVAENMGKQLLATPFISSTVAAQAILRAGSPEQREQFLPAIVEGSVASLALLDNEDWGDEGVELTAEPRGGQWQLNGRKNQVMDAGVAELFVVSAMIEGRKRLLLVPAAKLPEGAIQRQVLIDETKRSAVVDFSGVCIEAEQILAGDYDAVARDARLIAAVLLAAEATGAASACLDLTVEYLKTRSQFGRLIGSYQALKHPAVDILCAVDAAKSLLYHAATTLANKPLDVDAEIACRMAKAQASEALGFAGDRAVQFHGAMGFTYECDAQLYIRRAQWFKQVYGDAHHHRKRLAPLLLDHFLE